MREQRVTVRGVDLAYFEWGSPAGQTVLMLHATGFHARCWDGVVRSLGDGYHIIAMDQRGHGRSAKRGSYEWSEFGADAAAFVDELDLDAVVGVGHSMGGHAITQAASQRPNRFRALLLVDPVILDPDAYAEFPMFASPEAHPVARRRNRWRSTEEMYDRFADRHPFNLWDPAVLLDYCRFGLLPDGDGFVLACPPRVEASIYQGSAGRDIGDAIGTLPHPVAVLRARGRDPGARNTGTMDFARSPTWPGLAAAFPNGRDIHHPELSHFIPMQRPDLVADQIRSLVR